MFELSGILPNTIIIIITIVINFVNRWYHFLQLHIFKTKYLYDFLYLFSICQVSLRRWTTKWTRATTSINTRAVVGSNGPRFPIRGPDTVVSRSYRRRITSCWNKSWMTWSGRNEMHRLVFPFCCYQYFYLYCSFFECQNQSYQVVFFRQ